MKGYDPPFDSGLEEVLVCGKTIGRVPDVVRARALARARAIVAAADANPREPVRVARRRGFTIAWAAAAALIVVTAGAVAALRSHARRGQDAAPASSPRALPTVEVPALDSPPASPTAAPQGTLTSKPQRPGRSASAQESYAAELRLLQRAQVAYASHDFADVLALVAEHGRRFPNGRLAEEREALRVRALASSGRADEARRAAGAFTDRFPRSVFLPRLGRELR
jgi:hypothetical protein